MTAMVPQLTLVILACVGPIYGGVFFGPLHTRIEYGEIVRFCELDGQRIAPFSTVTNLNSCVKCSCGIRSGLRCQAIDTIETAAEETDCVYVKVGCAGKWVLGYDTTQPCPKLPKRQGVLGK